MQNQQQMAQMAAMNANNGAVDGTPMMRNMAQPGGKGTDPTEKLNTYIYDYFLRNKHLNLARAMLECDMKMATEKASPNSKMNGADAIEQIDDLPLPSLPPNQVADNSFLLDWWVQFWDIYTATKPRSNASKNAIQYVGHNRNLGQLQNEQRNQRMMMNNPMNAQYQMMRNGAMTNGNQTDLKRAAAMNNNRPTGNPMAGMQQMKGPGMMTAQMQRDGSSMDMNGQRPNSPGSNENAPSPNKRPRVDGGGMNAGNMLNNQFNEFMPQGPGAQQKNIEVYAQSLAHQHRVAMSNTSSPQGMNSGVQGSPMAQPGLEGQENLFTGNGPRPGNMPTNPPGAPQQGNHALQDYQMQLMLLEQQNKKRLLMARQEQDNQSGHPQQGVMGAPGFGAAMSPQGSRAGGPSPNPADQMKRGTPKLGQQNLPGSPMPEGIMGQQRASPAPNMNFDPSLAPPGMPPQFYPQGMPQNGPMGMRPPSSHPQPPNFGGQQITPAQMEAMRNGQMQQNGWRGGPQPGMMPGGQQMGGPMGQNPQQRQQMPPPPAPTNEQPRPEPSPSQSNPNPPTPSQTNKANPKKKPTKDNKKPANKKGANTGATPAATNGEEPPTPTSSTPVAPITPVHKQSFNQGQNGQPQQPVQPPAPTDQPMDNGGGQPFGSIDPDPNNFDLGLTFPDDGGALETFDFDSFLHTGDNDGLGNFGDFDFAGATEV
ncbi:hypothetical protein PSV09DRAFT_2437794 [Bipolaris maydis]|uniref:uncharacterized protein n=1 Tax=Cochliobolus heterostrophus TaxID=5016 RepID=UPI0024D1A060|nr:hypothetical protein J3E73DRAFT_240720 [Bipolaris maydis]KAJ6204406.1 hypothetical protein PSV09DRAFT_2437794 [Bipolaris maydis]KAJ6265689.1 hypothetical protein PSV08DRAFT_412811 [Bipolaris maydis]